MNAPTFYCDVATESVAEALEANRRQLAAGHEELLILYSSSRAAKAPAPLRGPLPKAKSLPPARSKRAETLTRIQRSAYPIHGIACRFDRPSMKDGERELVMRGAFAGSIASGRIMLLVGHARGPAMRSYATTAAGDLWVEEIEQGLYFAAALDVTESESPRLYRLIHQRSVHGVSTGGDSQQSTVVGGTRIVHQADVWELSLCVAAHPAREGTWVATL